MVQKPHHKRHFQLSNSGVPPSGNTDIKASQMSYMEAVSFFLSQYFLNEEYHL
jgi:hypothetical protein